MISHLFTLSILMLCLQWNMTDAIVGTYYHRSSGPEIMNELILKEGNKFEWTYATLGDGFAIRKYIGSYSIKDGKELLLKPELFSINLSIIKSGEPLNQEELIKIKKSKEVIKGMENLDKINTGKLHAINEEQLDKFFSGKDKLKRRYYIQERESSIFLQFDDELGGKYIDHFIKEE